MKVSL